MSRNQKSKLKKARGRKTSSQNWLRRQLKDPYVNKAKKQGYRSRAAFKLMEINEKFKFLAPGAKVIDLGAAPGSWSQVAAKIVNPTDTKDLTEEKSKKKNEVMAVDLQKIDAIQNVRFIHGDFIDKEIQGQIVKFLVDKNVDRNSDKGLISDKADVILSDMAPPSVGHAATNHLQIISLAEEVLFFAIKNLNKNGKLLVKILKGSEEQQYLKLVKEHFKNVKFVKPKASRSDSSEVYIYAELLR